MGETEDLTEGFQSSVRLFGATAPLTEGNWWVCAISLQRRSFGPGGCSAARRRRYFSWNGRAEENFSCAGWGDWVGGSGLLLCHRPLRIICVVNCAVIYTFPLISRSEFGKIIPFDTNSCHDSRAALHWSVTMLTLCETFKSPPPGFHSSSIPLNNNIAVVILLKKNKLSKSHLKSNMDFILVIIWNH